MTDAHVTRALSIIEAHTITPRDTYERAALFGALRILHGLGTQRVHEADEDEHLLN